MLSCGQPGVEEHFPFPLGFLSTLVENNLDVITWGVEGLSERTLKDHQAADQHHPDLLQEA